jgi:hypothetical protein
MLSVGVRSSGMSERPALQTQGVTSIHGLRECDGWRYIMIAAPDGLLLEPFEFDDGAVPCNVRRRL